MFPKKIEQNFKDFPKRLPKSKAFSGEFPKQFQKKWLKCKEFAEIVQKKNDVGISNGLLKVFVEQISKGLSKEFSIKFSNDRDC